jgi:hypothetical protein
MSIPRQFRLHADHLPDLPDLAPSDFFLFLSA